MLQVNASVSFEAKNRKEAEATVKAWSLNEGARVHVTATEILDPMEVNASGTLEAVPMPEPLPPAEAEELSADTKE